MSKVRIEVENLSKQYRLGEVGTGTISHDLNRFWYKIRGKEDPYSKIGAINDRASKGQDKYVWALKDIDFKANEGEVLGIIGKNGAGKSTLLKILSRITTPTTGQIKINGRVGALLEVGTGMHPELTGRENIFLNGAILGMTKHEIKSKFDEIIDFSGIAKYVDTPLKRYSSGMRVRLGFAVAAFLEPEILIVDEVLAVGDAEFQKRAIGKMQEVSQGHGRTVLFVSHNMGSMRQLCSKGLVLTNGKISYRGSIDDCIDKYIGFNDAKTSNIYENINHREDSDILSVKIVKGETLSSVFGFDDKISVLIKLKQSSLHNSAILSLRVKDSLERSVFSTIYNVPSNNLPSELYEFIVDFPKAFLVPNNYKLTVSYHIPNIELIRSLENVVNFSIEETGSDYYKFLSRDFGCVFADCEWKVLRK
ncbi:MAG: ABC transporter ATP-binding protein [Bacteroidia bacterium]